MLFKILFLIGALKLHDLKNKPFPPALLYCIPILLISLFSGSDILPLVIGGIIMFCVSYVYFGLLTKFNNGLEYYGIMVFGGAILVVFI